MDCWQVEFGLQQWHSNVHLCGEQMCGGFLGVHLVYSCLEQLLDMCAQVPLSAATNQYSNTSLEYSIVQAKAWITVTIGCCYLEGIVRTDLQLI